MLKSIAEKRCYLCRRKKPQFENNGQLYFHFYSTHGIPPEILQQQIEDHVKNIRGKLQPE